MSVYAVFSRRRVRGRRALHAAAEGARLTVCGLPLGVGSGLVRDGDYRGSSPCPRCWEPRDRP